MVEVCENSTEELNRETSPLTRKKGPSFAVERGKSERSEGFHLSSSVLKRWKKEAKKGKRFGPGSPSAEILPASGSSREQDKSTRQEKV